MADLHWFEIVMSAGVNLLLVGAAYGALKAKVDRLERDQELGQALVERVQDNQSSHQTRIQEQFVSYRMFEDFKEQVLKQNDELKSDVKQILILLGNKRAGH